MRIRTALSPDEWRRAGLQAAVVLGLHAVGFFILLALVVPHDYSLAGGGIFGLGVGITAYTLGLRHAFDADHIAAIDNTTRKLMAEGQRPLSVGFFFSLGHSTIVFVRDARDPQAVADVPARVPVRPGLRHRDRGRAARARGRGGRQRAAVLRDPLPADPVRGGDVTVRHHRRRVHELRLRLGVLAAGAQ